jgi:hypothetical protein
MTKTFKAFAGKNWVALTSREAFKEADKAGKPIRIEFDNGSFRVIKNADKLPEGKPVGFSKAAADREAAKQPKKTLVEKVNETIKEVEDAAKQDKLIERVSDDLVVIKDVTTPKMLWPSH